MMTLMLASRSLNVNTSWFSDVDMFEEISVDCAELSYSLRLKSSARLNSSVFSSVKRDLPSSLFMQSGLSFLRSYLSSLVFSLL